MDAPPFFMRETQGLFLKGGARNTQCSDLRTSLKRSAWTRSIRSCELIGITLIARQNTVPKLRQHHHSIGSVQTKSRGTGETRPAVQSRVIESDVVPTLVVQDEIQAFHFFVI